MTTAKDIALILGETKDDFRKAFKALASSEQRKDQRKFVAIYANLLELCLGRPLRKVPLDTKELREMLSEFFGEGGEE